MRTSLQIKKPDAGTQMLYINRQPSDCIAVLITKFAKLFMLRYKAGNGVGALVICHTPLVSPYKVITITKFGESAP